VSRPRRLPPTRPLIRDDLGVECPLVHAPHDYPAIGWFASRRAIDALGDPLRTELACATAAAHTYGLLGGLSLVFTASAVRHLLSAPATWPSWLTGLAGVILPGVLMWPLHPPVARWTRGRFTARLREAYLHAARCPSCGYSLAGILPSPDATTRCPECGRAWIIHETR